MEGDPASADDPELRSFRSGFWGRFEFIRSPCDSVRDRAARRAPTTAGEELMEELEALLG